MKIIAIIIICTSSLNLNAQNLNALILKGEELYQSGEYGKACNIFEKIHTKYKNDTPPRVFSNFLLTKFRIKEYFPAYKESLGYLKENASDKLGEEEANIYHNHALICEAIRSYAEALHFYQKANEIKEHSIRNNKIETLKPIVQKFNSLIPNIEEELIENIQLSKEVEGLEVVSYHPISENVENLIKKRIYDSSGKKSGVEIINILPIRIISVVEDQLYKFSTRVICKWWKNDYIFSMYFNEKGQILELSFGNQFIENCVIDNDGNYLISTISYPRGHSHWSIYSLYKYDIQKKWANPIFDTFNRLDISTDSLSTSFQSRIFIKDSGFYIEYGFSEIGSYGENKGRIEKVFDSTWLYKNGRVNTLKIPKVLKSQFEQMQKRYSYRKKYNFLGSVEFVEH